MIDVYFPYDDTLNLRKYATIEEAFQQDATHPVYEECIVISDHSEDEIQDAARAGTLRLGNGDREAWPVTIKLHVGVDACRNYISMDSALTPSAPAERA